MTMTDEPVLDDEVAEVTVVETGPVETMAAECAQLHVEYVNRMLAERDRLGPILWEASRRLAEGANSNGYGTAYINAAQELNAADEAPPWLRLWTPRKYTRVLQGTFVANATVILEVTTLPGGVRAGHSRDLPLNTRLGDGDGIRMPMPDERRHSGEYVTLRSTGDNYVQETYQPVFD